MRASFPVGLAASLLLLFAACTPNVDLGSGGEALTGTATTSAATSSTSASTGASDPSFGLPASATTNDLGADVPEDLAGDASAQYLVGRTADPSVFYLEKRAGSKGIWRYDFGQGGAAVGPLRVASSADGSVAVTGSFTGTATFGATTLSAIGAAGDAFVTKIDADGNVVWARSYHAPSAGTDNWTRGSSLAFGSPGNLVVGFVSTGSVDFGFGPLPLGDNASAIVAMSDTDGATFWSSLLNESGAPLVAVAFDDVIAVASEWRPSPAPDSQGLLVEVLDGTGAVLSNDHYVGADTPNDITFGALESFYVTGTFEGELAFSDPPLMATGGSRVYVAAFGMGTSPSAMTVGAPNFLDTPFLAYRDGTLFFAAQAFPPGTLGNAAPPATTNSTVVLSILDPATPNAVADAEFYGAPANEEIIGLLAPHGGGDLVFAGRVFDQDVPTSAGYIDIVDY